MEAAPLDQLTAMLTVAASSLLMILGALAKRRLVWQPRRPFWRRWRRR